jgi:hypothetical protein
MTQRMGSDKVAVMRGRIASLIALLLVAAALGGCSKCDFSWFDAPRACHSDGPR